jgi:hypothetical protein
MNLTARFAPLVAPANRFIPTRLPPSCIPTLGPAPSSPLYELCICHRHEGRRHLGTRQTVTSNRSRAPGLKHVLRNPVVAAVRAAGQAYWRPLR